MKPEVVLPADLQRYVDDRAAEEGFADGAAFLRDLVARDRDSYEADVRRVRALIQEGIDSGIVDAEPEDILDEIIADLHRAHG
ncbi:MAG: type II toxin-antitoxin system ParD family antitoxin [Sphingomonas sp.]|nr:type II toxin-antitoxin system ParD family antitoxin [Sphingomonas sp.]